MNPGRQTRLAEIGTEGQAKLSRAKARLRSRDPRAREIERRYLEGAGIAIDEDGEAASHIDVASFSEFESARIVAEGARNALASVREILELR